MKIFRKSFTYPHPVERVWAAMTDPDALAQWLMPNNFRPEVGREFEFRVDPMMGYDGVTRCRVLELDEPRRMVWSWVVMGKAGKKLPGPMRIEWELVPEGAGTRLTLIQTGLEALPWLHRMMMTMGWGTMMKRWLPKVIGSFERDGAAWKYTRLAKAPNRGHHKTKTVPAEFSR